MPDESQVWTLSSGLHRARRPDASRRGQMAMLAVLLEEFKQIQAQLSEQAIQLDAPPSLVECPHCGKFGASTAHVEGCAVALRRTTCRNGLHAKGFPQVPAGHEGAAGF